MASPWQRRSLRMAGPLHLAASHHLPMFITPPGATDVLMVVLAVALAGFVVMFGVLYFRLHSLPERMAHKTHKVQFEIVAILGLISLFTHMHIFWIAGLLLALIDLPDIGGWLDRIAMSLERIAMRGSRDKRAEEPDKPNTDVQGAEAPNESIAEIKLRNTPNKTSRSKVGLLRRVEDGPSIRPESGPGKRKELTD